MRAAVQALVAEVLGVTAPLDDEDLFDSGLIASSLAALELVLAVEAAFDFTVDVEDLDRENFRTVAAIAALAERKTEAARPSVGR
jgi:methoxymalonate biosynthesis acyl carrier protein